MKWWPCDAVCGDMLRVRMGSFYHYGVFVSEQEVIQFGLPPEDIFSIRPEEIRVMKTDIDTFCAGKIAEVAVLDSREKKGRVPPEETVRIAREALGTGGYDLLHNNCEHFAYRCVMGRSFCEAESKVRALWKDRIAKQENKE